MKKANVIISALIVMAVFTACNSDSGTATTSTTTDNTTVKSADSNSSATTTPGTGADNTGTTAQMGNKMPLSKEDSMFVMKAAAGGMMEVQGGTTAQQNAMSERVKNYGAMMVADHSKANSELMALASARGITPPADLPADMKKHLADMAKMKGKSFDSHYVSMMLTDHKKDVAAFEKQANSGSDAELKAFAAKTLPVLKMHLDSVQALSKMR